MLRHDCVHRNGFDKEGNELKVFTKEFVQDAADLIKAFVEGIEKAVQARSSTAMSNGPSSEQERPAPERAVSLASASGRLLYAFQTPGPCVMKGLSYDIKGA